MANYIGTCGYCNESNDLDDPDFILLVGQEHRNRNRIHVTFCSIEHLMRWAARRSLAAQRAPAEGHDG